jgi:hypothetical protein
MTATELRIDITRLEKVRRTGSKVVARCPACSATGSDRRGEHFYLNTADGKFGCAAFPGDIPHRQEVFALVGIRGDRRQDPQRDREWREDRLSEREQAEAKRKLIEAARARRAAIVAKWQWDAADVWEDSPTRIDQPLTELDPRFFMSALFPQEAVIWTGEVFHSGTRHADRFRTVRDWQDAATLGPMVSPATWPPGTTSRIAANVLTSPFTVLDFDGFDGKQPGTPEELREHIAASLAIVRWLRDALTWKLAAVLFTGSKSIHAWFHTPPPAVLQSLKDAAGALGIDSGLIGRGEHPCRLPGQLHAKTGGMSRVLWLQSPTA